MISSVALSDSCDMAVCPGLTGAGQKVPRNVSLYHLLAELEDGFEATCEVAFCFSLCVK